MLKAARSGRAVRFPKIIRSGENCGSLTSLIKICLRETVSPAFCVGQKKGTAIGTAKSKQEGCRSPARILRLCKVFNTGVDKFVEKVARVHANPSFFNNVMRFAQLLCNKTRLCKIFLRIGGRKNGKCFVWRKIQNAEKFSSSEFLFFNGICSRIAVCSG